MDNLGNSDADKPIPFDDNLDTGGASPGVSRAPLNLGGGGNPNAAPSAAPKNPPARPAAAPPAAAPARVPAPVAPAPVTATPVAAPPGGRITGCKTFFAKLHAGALDFMGDQISTWLKDNPDIYIKYTNVSVGDVQAKKTEPNLLIVLWY